ncbi:MAG TPA: glycine betaine ABC transporter substrate-binding protein [Halanaerobiales bacterium]|nr:glycine betaine ABC transporter substrate-binding protein [Halanaerobiales bacterium]
MKKLTIFILSFILLMGLVSGSVLAQNGDPIVLGEGDWPGFRAKNSIVEFILENIGYEVERTTARDPILHQGLTQGDIDIHIGSWMPQNTDMRKKYKGQVNYVTQNMTEGVYIMAVPQYVWEAGVKSHADLDKYADKFDKKLYVGPAGWASSQKMNKAIDEDIYGLGDWTAVNSSQSAMMAQLGKSIEDKDWICFVGWKPHWMNTQYDIKYLKDPKRLWESPYSWVDTLTRPGFEEDYPQVYRFLQQFRVDVEDNSQWINEIGFEERDEMEVAEEWVRNNILKVRRWLSLVKTPEGNNAYQTLLENLNMN